MKKLFLIVLALLTILCFVACDISNAPADTTPPDSTQAATTDGESVTTDAPEEDDTPSNSKVDIDYRDQLNAILEKDAEEDLQNVAVNVNMTIGMNFVADGVSSNNTIPMDFSLVMDKNNACYADISSAYLFDTDEPMTVVFVDGMLYSKNPSGELLKASATEEDILAMLGLDEMPSFDMSEIPEDELAELPQEVVDFLTDFKFTDLFKEIKLTSNKNDVRVITCTGLSDEVVNIMELIFTADEDDMDATSAAEMEAVLDLLCKKTPFSLSFTVNSHDQIVACKLDMKMDMTDVIGDAEGGDKYEITFSMNATIDRNPDTSVIAVPENADEYTEVALEDMFDMGGSETYPDGDIWGLNGVVTNVSDDGMATITYVEDYDDDWNEVYAEITVYVPEEWMADALALVGSEIEAELIDNGDGTYTLNYIQAYVETYWTYGMLESVETDADGNRYFTIMDIQYDDDFNEVLVPLTIYVPTDMIDTVSEFVGSEVSVNLLPDADGTYTLVSIDLW